MLFLSLYSYILQADISASGASPFSRKTKQIRKGFLLKYEEFIEYVKTRLTSYFEPEASIIIHRVLKNNNTELDGLSVLKKNQNISPTLYLNDYYEDYLCGTPLEELIEELYHSFLHPYTEFQFSISDFKKFDLMKEKVVYRLINYAQNKALLADVPHKQYLDLAIVYYLLLHSDEKGTACIMIRSEHMDIWNISPDVLHLHAEKNTPSLLPAMIRHMDEMLDSFLTENPAAEEEEWFADYHESFHPLPMFILTNQSHLNGAAVLLYKDILRDFAHTLEENFYILPSSIHEVILVPANGILSKTSLELMVRDVNQKEVPPMERLSDHVYFYNRFTHTITL